MKKIILSITAMVMLLLASCSGGSGVNQVLNHVPADVQLVVVGDLKTLLDAADITKDNNGLKMPKYINDMLTSRDEEQLEALNDKIKESGISTDIIGVVSDIKGRHPIIIVAIDDNKKFTKWLDNEDYDERDSDEGVTYYRKREWDEYYSWVAVKDNLAFIVDDTYEGSDFKPQKAIAKLIEGAKDKSFASTAAGRYISSGNAGGIAVKIPKDVRSALREEGIPSKYLDIFDGYLCVTAKVDGDEGKATMTIINDEGDTPNLDNFKKYIDTKATIDTKVMKYLADNESFVIAAAVKDANWDAIIDGLAAASGMRSRDKAQLLIAKPYLEKINGTVVLGIGANNGLKSLLKLDYGNSAITELSYTVAVQLEKGKGKSLLNDLKDVLESQHIDYDSNANGISIELQKDLTAYIQCDDDCIVLANHKISASNNNPVVKACDFGKYIAAYVLYLDKNTGVMQDLGLKETVEASWCFDAKDCEMVAELEIENGKQKGVAANFIDLCLKIYEQRETIQEQARQISDEYWYGGYYDYPEVEEVAVDDYYYGDSCVAAEVVEAVDYDW